MDFFSCLNYGFVVIFSWFLYLICLGVCADYEDFVMNSVFFLGEFIDEYCTNSMIIVVFQSVHKVGVI